MLIVGASIVGASGGMGTFAVRLARHFGAQVTAVCGTRHVDVVRSLCAGKGVGYTGKTTSGVDRHLT